MQRAEGMERVEEAKRAAKTLPLPLWEGAGGRGSIFFSLALPPTLSALSVFSDLPILPPFRAI
jgi:hypothetical protein